MREREKYAYLLLIRIGRESSDTTLMAEIFLSREEKIPFLLLFLLKVALFLLLLLLKGFLFSRMINNALQHRLCAVSRVDVCV